MFFVIANTIIRAATSAIAPVIAFIWNLNTNFWNVETRVWKSVAPIASFTSDFTTVTVGDFVQFFDTSSGSPTSFNWTFQSGTPSTSTLQDPLIQFNTVGQFTVSLQAINVVGSSSVTVPDYLTVNVVPVVANFTADTVTPVEGDSVQFTDTSTGTPTDFLWSITGATPDTSVLQNPSVVYNTAGTFTVALTASKVGSTDTETKVNFVTVAPLASSYIIEVDTQLAGSAADTFVLPTFGSGFDFTVNWGDNIVETYQGSPGNITHVYATAGIYDITINGLFPHIRFNLTGDRQKLLKVKQWGSIQWGSFESAYRGCGNLQLVALDAPVLTNVTNMGAAFGSCSNASFSTGHNFNVWNVTGVTNMANTFQSANFNRPLSNWDVSSVTNMTSMFQQTGFNQPIGNWDVRNVTSMGTMFFISGFNQDISGWNVSSVNNMFSMFRICPFNQPIGNWDVSGVTNMTNMFDSNSQFNQDISGWNVSNVNNMNSMFISATQFNQDISGWNVSNVNNYGSMFKSANNFNQDLGAWVIKGPNLSRMFENMNLMSTENYSRTLIGWANTVFANGNLPINISMTLQTGRTFNNTQFTTGNQFNDAVSARNYLLTTCNWDITGDAQV